MVGMQAPIVTVVIPAYNAAWCIARALASVRAQTLQDFEALIIDDGSADDTAEVVRQTVGDDARFRLIRQPNGGVAAARNRGIAEARGAYLAPLDSDDIWAPTFLEDMIAALEAAGPQSVFAFSRSRWIDEHDQVITWVDAPWRSRVGYRELLLYNPVGNNSCAVMRRAAVLAVGGYDLGIVRRHRCGEDWLLMMRLSWRGTVVPVDKYLVQYRISPNSASHALTGALGGMLEAVNRAAREGPPLPRPVYWRARSLAGLWLLRRALKQGHWSVAARLLGWIYLANPLWFLDPELRRPVASGLKRLFRITAVAPRRAAIDETRRI